MGLVSGQALSWTTPAGGDADATTSTVDEDATAATTVETVKMCVCVWGGGCTCVWVHVFVCFVLFCLLVLSFKKGKCKWRSGERKFSLQKPRRFLYITKNSCLFHHENMSV